MAHNTQAILIDKNGKPIPQYFNQLADAYQSLQGEHGAARNILYGADGQPISVVDSKLAVRATEIESLLNDIKGKDYATQTTLAAILAQLGTTASAAVTDPTASAALIQLLKGLLKQLQGGGTGAAPVQLSGSNVEIGGVTFAVSGGDTLRGKSADKPDAVAAHAVIPFCYYFSVDTGIIEVTDGTKWVVI